ncbi:MAG: glycosyltransferase family 39 protein [Actinobacteria bacterium]|nr:glycosyltransferase family 39 protein [Actinomycetota bacterium]MBV8395533.1 glycosyltransferase family 39 protein [Actinomycetota bacterium]MBV8598106.1 glycosyltransferase family 39 protein [Actinomycetota bacterium]
MGRLRYLTPAGYALALGLVFYVETRAWLVSKFPYFLDEGILAQYAQTIDRDASAGLISLDAGVRPGLCWLTVAAMEAFHLQPLDAIRAVAVVFGLLAAVCGFVVARRYVGRAGAAGFAALALVTPYLFLYDALGLREPVIAGVVVAAFLIELELARRPRGVLGLALGVAFALTIWTKESGKIAMYLLPLSLVYFPFRAPDRRRLAVRWCACVAGAFAIAYAATWPLALGGTAYQRLGATEHTLGYTRSFSAIAGHPLRYFEASWPDVQSALTSYLTYPVLVLALAGLAVGLRRRTRFTILVAAWASAQIAAAVWIATIPYPRYLMPAVPFVLLLCALAVEEAARRVRQPVLVAAGALLLVPAVVFDAKLSFSPASAPYPSRDRLQYVTGYTSGFGYDRATDELALITAGRPTVVETDPFSTPVPLEVLTAQRGLAIDWRSVGDPKARDAQIVVVNNTYVPNGVGTVRKLWSYVRPGGGIPLEIYLRR